MANRLEVAEIIVGGKVSARLLEEFLGRVASTGAKVGKHDGGPLGAKTAEQLRRAIDKNGHLLLVAAEFDDLEGFCVEHGIAFDRRGDGGDVCFRPGMNKPMNNRCDGLLDAGKIRPVAKELAGLVTVTLTKEKVLAAAAVKVIRHLNALLPPEIEPLPPLEIEE